MLRPPLKTYAVDWALIAPQKTVVSSNPYKMRIFFPFFEAKISGRTDLPRLYPRLFPEKRHPETKGRLDLVLSSPNFATQKLT
jgi:hypothetical protein